MKNIYPLLLIILLILNGNSLSAFCQQEQKKELMKNIRFIPEEFNEIELGYAKGSVTPCSPGYPDEDIPLNTLLINVPEKIIYNPVKELIPVIPVCTAKHISLRRSFKYDQDDMVFYVRIVSQNKIASGKLFDEDEREKMPLSPEVCEQMEKMRDQKREEMVKYSDDELNEGQSSVRFMNLNVMTYVDMPFLPGKYEIWYTFRGLESNHSVVEIIVGELK